MRHEETGMDLHPKAQRAVDLGFYAQHTGLQFLNGMIWVTARPNPSEDCSDQLKMLLKLVYYTHLVTVVDMFDID